MNIKSIGLGMVLGGFLASGAGLIYETYGYMAASAPASAVAVAKPLLGFSVDPDWVKRGAPNFQNSETTRSPDGKTIGGLWACDGPSTFEWRFHMDETVHLLEGLVEVDYQGRKFTLRPGDTATFHAGTRAVWHIPQNAKKAYTLYQPPRLVALWRRLASAIK